MVFYLQIITVSERFQKMTLDQHVFSNKLMQKIVNAYVKSIKLSAVQLRVKMTCKGICVRHKAMKPVGTGRYSIGQKRCQVCELFIMWDGFWCPCCGYRLRTRPRNLKFKAKMKARKKIEEYQLLLQQQQQKRQR
jgi:hypothetical protein